MSEITSTKSKHAACLNALNEMQQSPAYAVRRAILAEAERLIAQYEKDAADHAAAIRRAKAEVNNLLNLPCGLAPEEIAKIYLEYGALYYQTKVDFGAHARLVEVIKRARLDGYNLAMADARAAQIEEGG